ELAGHSSPTLTARYSHRRLHDLAGAVEKLPSFLPEQSALREVQTLRATGTHATTAAERDETVLADCLALSGRSERISADSGGLDSERERETLVTENPANPSDLAAIPGHKAERTGFEPVVEFYPHTGLANRRYRPLSHLSKVLCTRHLRL